MEHFGLSESEEHEFRSLLAKDFPEISDKCQPSTIVNNETVLVTLQGTNTSHLEERKIIDSKVLAGYVGI